MAVIPVAIPANPYEIHLDYDLLGQVGSLVQPLVSGEILLLVSHPQIYARYGEKVTNSLEQAGFRVHKCLIPQGERFKTLRTLQTIHGHCYEIHLDRRSALIALGGGVVGDITGFAAATWLRGIPFVQIPTSLLAMVDAAIGGKTGVNTPQGKNLVGAFHQPKRVIIDPQVLASLPARQWRSGLAEVIKYGVVWDADLFPLLANQTQLAAYPRVLPEVVLELIARSCQAKAEIVAKDEKEAGLRALLNYGHTFGHALETATHYRQYTHGEAVALGMIAAGRLAVKLGHWSNAETQQQEQLIKQAGLPSQFPQLDPQLLIELMQGDKKVQSGQVRFVLPTALGHAHLEAVAPELVLAAL